jgi:hypothetical protein
MAVVAVHDQQVTVALAAQVHVSRLTAFDPVRLCDGLVRNWVERETLIGRVIHAVALVSVVELHRLLRLTAVHDDIREAVNLDAAWRHLTAEVWMETTRRADERNEVCR